MKIVSERNRKFGGSFILMLIIGRLLLVGIVVALVGEALYALDLFGRVDRMPREQITVGSDVEQAIHGSSALTKTVDTILSAPIELPIPPERMPPPLHPSQRRIITENKNAGDQPKTAAEPASPVADSTTVPPPPAPRPEFGKIDDSMSKVSPDKGEARKQEQVVTETLPATSEPSPIPSETSKSVEPALSKESSAPDLKGVSSVAANTGGSNPFSPPPARPEPPIAEPPAFVRPEPGQVTADPLRVSQAIDTLTQLGATVAEAIDREGRVLPDRYSVTIDPSPDGNGFTRLNPQLQNQLGRALAEMGDSLHTLTLRNLGLGNLSSLGNSVGLVSLDLTGSKFLNINPLIRLPRLEVLNVSKTHVDNMILAAQIRNLRVLNLTGAGVVEISPLSALEGLEELYLNDTKVSSIEAVSRMPRLKVLDCGGSDVSDIRPLTRNQSLRRLGLARTRVADLEPLGDCNKLLGLDLSGCVNIKDIAPIGRLARLEMLSLFGVPIERIDALVGCRSLNTLELSRTKVRDIDAAKELQELSEIYLRGLTLTNSASLKSLPSVKLLDLTGTTFSDGTTIESLRNSLAEKGVIVKPQPSGE